jgi:hypothetical protein
MGKSAQKIAANRSSTFDVVLIFLGSGAARMAA